MTLHAPLAQPDLDREIGERALVLMFRQKVTQVALAHALDLNQAGVARRLRGETSWKSTDLAATARLLNTTIAYLVGEVGDPSGPTVHPLGLEPRTHWLWDNLVDSWSADDIDDDAPVEPPVPIERAFELRQRRDELVSA